MTTEIDGIRYSRPEPAEWTNLVAEIDEAYPGAERPVEADLARFAIERALTIQDTEQLEATAYYGWGRGMANLSRTLHDSTTRAEIATQIADSLTRDNVRMQDVIAHPGPRSFNAFLGASMGPISRLAYEGYRAQPTAAHLAADALTVAVRARRSNFDPFAPINGSPNLGHINNVKQGRAAANIITANATAGSIVAHYHLRKAQAEARQRDETVTSRAPIAFAMQSAALHTEEFQGPVYPELISYEQGMPVLNRSTLPARPVMPENRVTDIAHAERLGCPAIQVQHAIPGMLELMVAVERHQG